MVFSALTVALFQFSSHSDAVPKACVLCCPAAHTEAAEKRCLTQLLGNEMETLPGVLQILLASVVAAHTLTGTLNSCSSRFFPSFQLGDPRTSRRLAGTGGFYLPPGEPRML